MLLIQFVGRILVCAATIAALILTSQTLDAKPLPDELAKKERALHLEAASDWQLEFADDRCRLARKFESDDGPGMVLFEQLAPGERFNLTIAGPDFARARRGSWFYGGMRSDRPMEVIDPLEYALEGYENAIALAGISINGKVPVKERNGRSTAAKIELTAAELVKRVVLQRSNVIVSFETGNLRAPLEALNNCSADLLVSWGLNADAHNAYRPPQMPDERAYFTRLHHDLTSASGNEGHESQLRVRAIIANDGSVTDCYYEYAFSSGGLAPNVCTNIQQMRFDPAIALDGKPIASVYSRSLFLSRYDPWTSGADGARLGSEW